MPSLDTPLAELTVAQWATLAVTDWAELILNGWEVDADMNATIRAAIEAVGQKSADLSRVTATTTVQRTDELADGSGDNQVNKLYQDRGTVASGADPTVVDLYADLPDDFGVAFGFGAIKALQVHNASTTDTLLVGDAAADPWAAPWGTGEVAIPPSSTLQVTVPLAGQAVTSTARNLRLEHGSGTAGEVQYEFVVLGVAK